MARVLRILVLLFLIPSGSRAQVPLDSLWSVWNDVQATDSARLQAMQLLAWRTVFERPDSGMALARKQLELAERGANAAARYEALTTLAVGSSMRSDLRASLTFLEECLLTARSMKDLKREANTYSNMSNVYKNLGDLPLALKHLQQSLRIDLELDNKEGLAGTYNNIGNIHTELQDLNNALIHYEKSAALAELLDSDKGRAQALMNLGATHLALGERTVALGEFERSLVVYRKLGRKLEMGMAFNNLGRCYTEMGRHAEAFASLDSARVLFEALENKRLLARNHYYRGSLFLEKGDARKAREACEAGVRLARATGLAQQRKECSECLVMAYEHLGDLVMAFSAQKEYMQVSDSLEALNNGKEVLRMDMQQQFQERQIADSLDNARQRYERDLAYQRELGRQREQRNLSLFIGGVVLLTAIGLWNRLRYTRRSRALIQRERDRSDELLHNILPEEVAAELKSKGHADTRSFEQVTILFTDFQGFTQVSERLSPAELVEELNACFKAFDAIVDARGVEKIKTIGDAYMAAGGVPEPRTDATLQTVMAALDMQNFIRVRHAERTAQGLPAFRMRAGLHTGPVVAGIVGTRKFAYDIWGDTVNTASRMESSGSVDEVNISGTTRELLRDAPGLLFEARGKVQAKGKGELEMFFVRHA
ncbi:MAG: adenylate/guanylate cyclase domain-containing protein [Flavobacteriales bacterium]